MALCTIEALYLSIQEKRTGNDCYNFNKKSTCHCYLAAFVRTIKKVLVLAFAAS